MTDGDGDPFSELEKRAEELKRKLNADAEKLHEIGDNLIHINGVILVQEIEEFLREQSSE